MEDDVNGLVAYLPPNDLSLLNACSLGDLEAATYLLEKCQANVNYVGTIHFNNSRIDLATPLWCAATSGNINLVQTLIKYKAHVNSAATSSNSTPLLAACYGGHFEIVKCLIEHGANFERDTLYDHTCLMIACLNKHYEIVKYLLKCGADVNRKSLNGFTALHNCSQSGSLDIIKMLLKHGAKFQCNSIGVSPLLIAANAGHESVVEYFFEEFHFTKIEVVHALELLGAGCIGTTDDATKTYGYWRRAMQLRLEEDEFPLDVPLTPIPLYVFVAAKEANTLFKLEQLFDTSNEKVIAVGNGMRRHAILIRERLLGVGSSGGTAVLKVDNGRYIHYGTLGMGFIPRRMQILVTDQEDHEPLNRKTVKNLLLFSEMFSCLMSQNLINDDSANISVERPISFQCILDIFKRALKEIARALDQYKNELDLSYNFEFHSILCIALHLIDLMCKSDPPPNKSEKVQLEKYVNRLINMDPKSKNGWKLLHIACFKDSSYINRFPILKVPSVEVVDLLLKLGVCPNVADLNQNSPLHIAAMERTCAPDVYVSLLKHGAHPDLRNSKGQTPLQLAKLYGSPFSDTYWGYMKLQCLSAQVVQAHKIAYKGVVPKRIETFLDNH